MGGGDVLPVPFWTCCILLVRGCQRGWRRGRRETNLESRSWVLSGLRRLLREDMGHRREMVEGGGGGDGSKWQVQPTSQAGKLGQNLTVLSCGSIRACPQCQEAQLESTVPRSPRRSALARPPSSSSTPPCSSSGTASSPSNAPHHRQTPKTAGRHTNVGTRQVP